MSQLRVSDKVDFKVWIIIIINYSYYYSPERLNFHKKPISQKTPKYIFTNSESFKMCEEKQQNNLDTQDLLSWLFIGL